MNKWNVVLFVFFLLRAQGAMADWPMWRHDAGRTATTAASIPAAEKLSVVWARSLPQAKPAYRDVRLQFDGGYEPVVYDQRVFVGSNVDDSVTAFDLLTGERLWQFFTDGPVRFAPVAAEGRVIVGSDDGCVYAIDAVKGTVLWKHRAVPSRRLVLGNGRLISVWPVRGGPVLHQGQVFFAAGVWPLEGTFVYCLDAETGKTVWRNDSASYRYGSHPHNAEAYGGLAPQGYLLIEGEDLVVPSSQAYPARFDWKTGALKSFDLPAASRMPGGWFASTPAEQEAHKLKRRGLLHDETVNRVRHEDRPRMAGLPSIKNTLRVGGREINFTDGLAGVDEAIHSVVASDGMLVVATKSGRLVALAETSTGPVTIYPEPAPVALPISRETVRPPIGDLPQHGYALVLGGGNMSLVEALVQQTHLTVVEINADAAHVATLRQASAPNNSVHYLVADPSQLEFPPYVASLIVLADALPLTRESVRTYYETLRPFGGIMLGRASNLRKVAEAAELPGVSIKSGSGGWTIVARSGALEGATNYAGGWKANADLRVKAPLGLLWYGDSITHFKRSPQPEFVDGVMVSTPKNWTDASTRKGRIDYRLLETVFSDIYTGRILAGDEAMVLRKTYAARADRETVQPSQYRPPHQKDWMKPEPPRVGERINPLTGISEARVFPKSYGCDGGVDYGYMYSMRSGTPAFYDKRVESGTVSVSGPRSGCTNSIIPSNGVLNLPYFYEGCTCSYPLPVALALVSRSQKFEQWASWGRVPAEDLKGKIQRVGLNFGAPGDRMTEEGTLWLDIPNVGGPSPEIQVSTVPSLTELEFSYRHSQFLASGRGWPWVAGSGCSALRSISVRGLREGEYLLSITSLAESNGHFETKAMANQRVGGDGLLTVVLPDGMAAVGGIEMIRLNAP